MLNPRLHQTLKVHEDALKKGLKETYKITKNHNTAKNSLDTTLCMVEMTPSKQPLQSILHDTNSCEATILSHQVLKSFESTKGINKGRQKQMIFKLGSNAKWNKIQCFKLKKWMKGQTKLFH